MSSSAPKPRVVAIKVDEEMRRFLALVPNASQFIRRAIFEYLQRGCPLCRGEGVVPRSIGEHFEQTIATVPVRCADCNQPEPLPHDLAQLCRKAARRWQRFLNGEPYRCEACDGQGGPSHASQQTTST